MSLAVLAAILAAAAPAAAESISAAPHTEIMTRIDRRYDETASIARKLWEFAEVGYKETSSSKLLQDALRAEGFVVKGGAAGIPTAFVAEWEQAGPQSASLRSSTRCPGSIRTRRRPGPRSTERPPGTPAGTISSGPARSEPPSK